MRPFSASAPNRYCRLFPPESAPDDHSSGEAAALEELCATMVDDERRVCPHWPPHTPEKLIASGYTYFGQFLHHDLTDDSSSLADARRFSPEEIENHQYPRFDLGNLYGRGPTHSSSAHLYERNDVRLRVARVSDGGSSFDLATSREEVITADRRATENVILRQMTAFFARLHNCAVEQWQSRIGNPLERFARARLQTSWQFQRLIYEDYLPRILDPEIYREIFVEDRPRIKWDEFAIPVEFSVAAMRFGHSMVRSKYFLSRTSPDLNLLEIAGRSRQPRTLEPEWQIEWGQFFQSATPDLQAITVRPIDTKITAPLHHLPLPALHVFNAGIPTSADGAINLPLLTLLRGAALALPSGQAAARAFGEPELTERELTRDCAGDLTAQGEVLQATGMLRATPMFFYLLKESEVRAHGNHLGRTGSRIVAEVFHAARRFDSLSYINHPQGAAWPVWEAPEGPRQFKSLAALFEIAPRI